MKNEKKTYHDYVIKDGKFIGQFDEMYADFNDHWTQSIQPNKYSRMAGIIHVKNFQLTLFLNVGVALDTMQIG